MSEKIQQIKEATQIQSLTPFTKEKLDKVRNAVNVGKLYSAHTEQLVKLHIPVQVPRRGLESIANVAIQ